MAILTPQEAAALLRYSPEEELPESVTSVLLPAIDDYIKNATGKDWGKFPETDSLAKLAAGVLLVRWYQDPGLIGSANDVGIKSIIGQLSAKAVQEKQAVVE